ncbi:hypothetical protein [Flavobacterium pallidum]|uniref:Phr family secreted Rap phosphatase inhibitor n=1 Tax=Flavobacterium pallidum TaxID=2172098 RepID=A0A2S1SEW4_9FLAO|nr:hypothetical protein [Flavobacterium pallidum]AWI24929.1 hypothetical protein HYN49_02910 [Flavobacterium pallidum]
MKKIILIAAVVLVAVIGLTSFNGKEQHKEKGNGALIASLEGGPVTGGSGSTGIPPGGTGGTGKKTE